MRVLFIGDIFGRPARNAVKNILPELMSKHQPDLVIANCENTSGGMGITKKNYDELVATGIDIFTSGNHIWDKTDIIPFLDDKNIRIIRPINYPVGVPGRGAFETEILGEKVVVINALGRVFIGPNCDDPFKTVSDEIKKHSGKTIIIDFHAEATSEKYAFYKYFEGRVTAIIGSHTHVQTADAQISNNGTAFISDIGMVGVYDSIIGAKKESIVNSYLTQMPFTIEVENGPVIFNAAIIETNRSHKATKITPIYQLLK